MTIVFHHITCNYTLKDGHYTAFHVLYIYIYIYVIRLLFNDSKHHSLCRNTQIYFMAYACRSAERFNGMYGCS